MNKNEIAQELLHNTESIILKDLIEEYLLLIAINEPLSEELTRFQACLSYIEKTGFDIKGWALIEIPIYFTYCFADEKNNQFFDLDVYETGRVYPKYVDNHDNEQDVETIQEAINKYKILQSHIADARNS